MNAIAFFVLIIAVLLGAGLIAGLGYMFWQQWKFHNDPSYDPYQHRRPRR